MKSVFMRSVPPKKYKAYASYRNYIRSDFKKCCAYCLIHEDHLGGEKAFEIDHRNPKSKAQSLKSAYDNLYWCCHICNKQKGNTWPTVNEIACGLNFIDTAAELYSTHFTIRNTGAIYSNSDVGVYTRMNLHLNRPGLNKTRKRIINITKINGVIIDWDIPMDNIIDDTEPKAI